MKFLRSSFTIIIISSVLVTLQACKAKKMIQKPAPVAETTKPVNPVQPPKPVVPVQQQVPPAKPDFTFANIQFEFDSDVLKTDSYPTLDKVSSEMKMDPSVKLDLNGYASIEGTAAHNMMLSRDRANSVKQYLVNSGVSSADLIANGYGTANPIADNNTDAGKVLNRRVEIHKLN
ncbi:MAG TPA: OmpA family protein [Mucilaginibacter sp.]|jgi:OOP family OmpA-OmpF porin